ncbi:MAG: hypothetical protein MUE73_18035 [Planctomycetes bacterium]|nr:hypothetical protein [Planctomycetota bacterium]
MAPLAGEPADCLPPGPPPAASADDRGVFLRGSPDAIHAVTNDPRHLYTGAEVEALIERIDRARTEGDGMSFHAALSGLAAARTPAARQKLLALAADGSLPMPFGSCAVFFCSGLSDCDLPGVATAARNRLAAGEADARQWARLLADHGDRDDIEVVLSSGFADEVARSPNPAALARTVELLAAGELSSQGLHALVRFHPEEAFPFILRQLRDESAALRPPGRLDLLGGAVTSPRVPDAKAFLSSLTDPAWRLAAVWAVVRMTERGLDISGLEEFLVLPVVILEEADESTPEVMVTTAAHLIGGSRILRDDRALAALATCAERLPPGKKRDALEEIAAELRTALGSPWR